MMERASKSKVGKDEQSAWSVEQGDNQTKGLSEIVKIMLDLRIDKRIILNPAFRPFLIWVLKEFELDKVKRPVDISDEVDGRLVRISNLGEKGSSVEARSISFKASDDGRFEVEYIVAGSASDAERNSMTGVVANFGEASFCVTNDGGIELSYENKINISRRIEGNNGFASRVVTRGSSEVEGTRYDTEGVMIRKETIRKRPVEMAEEDPEGGLFRYKKRDAFYEVSEMTPIVDPKDTPEMLVFIRNKDNPDLMTAYLIEDPYGESPTWREWKDVPNEGGECDLRWPAEYDLYSKLIKAF